MTPTFLFWLNEGEEGLFSIWSFSDLKSNSIMTITSLFYQNLYSALSRPFIFIISLLIPLMAHEYVLFMTFVTSKIVLRHPNRDASKNVSTLTVSEFDEILCVS